MSAEVIVLKDWLSEQTHGTAERLFLSTRLAEARQEMIKSVETMMSECGKILEHCDSDATVKAAANLGRLRDALHFLPLSSPEASRLYREIAEIIEQIGDLVSHEIRFQMLLYRYGTSAADE